MSNVSDLPETPADAIPEASGLWVGDPPPAKKGRCAPLTEEERKRTLRTKGFPVRLTEAEYDRLKKMAAKEKLKISDVIRNALADWGVKTDIVGWTPQRAVLTKKVDPALIRQLAAVGNLLNQMTRTFHVIQKSGEPLDVAYFALRLAHMDHVLAEIYESAKAGELKTVKEELKEELGDRHAS
jgi:hypothetical protein